MRSLRACWSFRCLVAWLAAFVVTGVAAGQGTPTKIVEMQVRATAPTTELALRRAIAQAARDVNGASIAADATRKQRFEDSLRDLDLALSAPQLTPSAIAADIRVLSKGLIDRVAILESRDVPPEREVTALVGVAVFENKLASRKTIAVMNFRASSGTYAFSGAPVAGTEIVRRLAAQATERLVQTSIVTVLDRQHIDEVAKERNFVELYGRTPEELARFGKMLGADLLLVGSIETAGLETVTHTVEASGYRFSQSYAGMTVSARLVDVETGAIQWADSVTVSFDNARLSRLFPGGVADASGTLSLLIDEMSTTLVGAVIERVAPIKVALVDGDVVWLNRGTGRLTVGQRLQIRGGGQEVVDPDTGESLGQAERTVAVVEVVAVDAKKSQCRILEGLPTDVRSGHLARPLAMP